MDRTSVNYQYGIGVLKGVKIATHLTEKRVKELVYIVHRAKREHEKALAEQEKKDECR